MNEKIIIMGEKKNLVGILSDAENSGGACSRPSVLFLNSGLVHRPGPFRMNVDLSRQLASIGFDVLRMDISGVGDSEIPANDSRSYEQRNLDDIGEGIRYLAAQNTHGVIVMGLCTGADHAHKAASKYSEVVGTILFDAYGYPTLKFYLKRYGPILFSPKRVINIVIKVLKKIFRVSTSTSSSGGGADAYFWKLPPEQDYMKDMENLDKRNVKQCYIYSGGVSDYYNYKDQFKDKFGSSPIARGITVKYHEQADHIYSLRKDREKMFEEVKSWISKNFGT